MRRTTTVAWLGVALVGVSGCGNSTLSDAQLQSQATRVCAQAAIQTARIPTAGLNSTPAFLQRGLQALAPELKRLRALDPSQPTAGSYHIALQGLSAELAAIRHAETTIAGGADPVATIKGLAQQLAPIESSTSNAWQSLGIPTCAQM